MASAGVPGRLVSLDAVRGVAVLGILLLNIVAFAMPQAAYLNPRAYGGWHGPDLAVWFVNFLLFDSKMRGLFSLLFGASMLLVIERAEAAGRSPAAVHYSRMGWLLAFGLAHLWLVWEGDILTQYALIGMIGFAMRRLPVERLLVLGVMFFLLHLALLAMTLSPLWMAESGAEAARHRRLLAEGFGVPSPAAIARELAIYRSDYAAILAHRFAETRLVPVKMPILFGPETLAYMLFGMAALRSGMLRGAWERARYRRWLLACWGIALPVQLAAAAWLVRDGFGLKSVALGGWLLGSVTHPAMTIGWACLILLLLRPGGALTARLAAAGRMAFTNYLAASLICTTLFYGYGLGWFGHLSRWQLYAVVACVWTAMLLWSKPWLARFRYGPFEWLWRSLARGRPQPMRGAAA